MEIIAIIPARAGSKRLPGKNLKLLGGKPLVAWSIEPALQSQCFSRVLVSTEDSYIAETAKKYGAEVPWLRPKHLATDEATAEQVVLDVLNCLHKENPKTPDAVMLLQPTSPFRSVNSIHRAIDLFKDSGGESVVSVSPATTHPYLCKVLNEKGEMKSFVTDKPDITRTQDMPPAYQLDGVIYLTSAETILKEKSFYSKNTQGLIIEDPYEGIDIDTHFDWLMAQTVLAQREAKDIK